ncbi:MAG: PQQ-binding-like beta-propeller repeat protein [Xanthomonadales bacterium]|nr:PQQ-binding-like beta-propeller repeat protein [Xanthomonadales bacterium]
MKLRSCLLAATTTALLLAGGCASKPPALLTTPAPAWEVDFQHPISYHKSMGDDLLIVGTTRHLQALDPRTGERLWRLRNVNTNARDVYRVADEAYLLVNDAAGGAFDDAGTHVVAVARADGALYWEAPVVNGRVLHSTVDLAGQRLYAVTVRRPHGDDSGLLSDVLPAKGLFSGFQREPELVAIDLIEGRLLWQRAFGEEVEMRPSLRPGVGGAGARAKARPFDLGLYHPPFLVEDQVCVTYAGVHCYRSEDGVPTWSDEFDVIDDDLALSYPAPIVNPGLLIAGDTEQLRAYRPGTGEPLWRSDDLGRMPQLLDGGNLLIARIGGRYFDLEDEEWQARGRFGVAAVNKRNGNILWEYDRVRRSITNLQPVDAYLWFADDEHLFALDRLDGSVAKRVPHKLGEPPLYAVLNRTRQIVLISEYEIGGYDLETGTLRWYEAYPPPGPGVWKRLAAALMTASGAVFKLGSNIVAYGNISGLDHESVIEDATGYVGKKLRSAGEELGAVRGFANLSGDTQYFLTRPRGMDDVVLAAVDIQSGKTRELTLLPSQAPNLVIDEINGLIFQADNTRLVAVPLSR